MSGILTTARLVFKNGEARLKAIEAFQKIIAYTSTNEPEVLQYVCALPIDDSRGTEIYMIEEYTNQAASDAHLTTKPVQDLIQLFTTGDVLASPPEVHNCPIKYRKSTGLVLPVSSDPVVALLYSTSSSVNDWKDAAENAIMNEKGFSFAAVVEDVEAKGIRAEYILEDWKVFEAFKTMATDMEVIKIKPIHGFLGREDKSKL